MKNNRILNFKVVLPVLAALIVLGAFFFINTRPSEASKQKGPAAMLSDEELKFIEDNDQITLEGFNFLISDLPTTTKDVEIKDGKLTLHTKNSEDIVATMTVDKAVGKNYKIEIFEGDKHDTVEIDENGDMYLDGQKVIVEEETTDVRQEE